MQIHLPSPHPPPPPPPPPPQSAAAARADVLAPLNGGPPRGVVLVVDDSTLARGVAVRALRAHGYAVRQADSGRHGLAEWEGHKSEIVLVVSDVVMPDMDGLSMARELRKRSQTLPLVLMSSKLDDDSRWIAEEAGFRLLQKPFKDQELTGLVDQLLPASRPA